MRLSARLGMGLLWGLLCGVLTTQPLASQSAPQPVFSVEQLAGDWTGSVRFFDKALAERVGELPIALAVSSPGAGGAVRHGTGRIGAAAVRITDTRAHRDRLELMATLDRPPHADAALKKEHLVIVITRATPTQMTGEVHLKSNRVFDPRMREGYVVLERAGGR